MPQIIGSIPDLIGYQCEDLLVQEYWYRGELADPANIFFLKPRGKPWQRFFFDCGVLFWRENALFPDVQDTDPADERHYVIVDLGVRFSIRGRRLQQIDLKGLPPLIELSLRFDGNLLLTLRNDAVQDVSSFEVTSPEPAV